MTIFESKFKEMGPVELPSFSQIRIMMMPIVIDDMETIPTELSVWKTTIRSLFEMTTQKDKGKVGYLTIDNKTLKAGETLRRPGLHVDGIYGEGIGGWGGGSGPWAGRGGMLCVSTPAGCRAWTKNVEGWPDHEGKCDHLVEQFPIEEGTLLKPNVAYWMNPLCVHESLPMSTSTPRTFVRLSTHSTAPWFEGYTENPLGIEPTGPILSRREFMNTTPVVLGGKE